MGYASHIGRLGALAVALGAGLAATAGVAFAQPSLSSGASGTTDSTRSTGPNISVSTGGVTRVQKGETGGAISSGPGSVAIAHGVGTTATATGGQGTVAIAKGDFSSAVADFGRC